MEKESDVTIDTSDKINLYNQTLKMLNKSTRHLIQLLTNEDDKMDKKKEFNNAMIDLFQSIKDYITDRVSFPSHLQSEQNLMQLAISIPFQKYEIHIFDVTTLKVECN